MTWTLNFTIFNDNLVKEERKKENKGFLEFNENEGTTYPNLWDIGKLIALSASKKKLERAYTTSLRAYLKAQEQKEANTPKRSRRQEIVKLRAQINQRKTKKTIQRISKTRSWFFEGINKIDNPLDQLTKGPRGSIQINKIRNEKEDITTETKVFQKIIRSYYKSLHSTKLENLDETYGFLDIYHIPKLNQEQVNNQTGPYPIKR